VASLYTEGVDGVVAQAVGLTSAQWSAPACGSWSAADTMRHLVSVAGWYHDWLDRAIEGDESRPFPGEQIDAYTAAALDEQQHLTPDEAVAEFRRSATDYLERAGEHLDLPYAFPFGTVTVGLHLGVAAAEWHLHAWDLSATTDHRYRPDEPGALMLAVGQCVAAASGGFKGAVVRRVTPLAARRSPWETLLRRSGRG
jgi:uncharacterized protein (TIGR03083 family)